MRIPKALVLGGLLLALGVAGCGGDDTDGSGVATAGGSTPSAAAAGGAARPGSEEEMQQHLRFAQCMRSNGVPEFPDPKVNSEGGINISLPEGVSKEKVDAAEQKCQQYLPNGGEPQKADPKTLEQLRTYAQCMRSNGIPNFPDPTDSGLQIDPQKLGLEPDDPRMKAAEEACRQHQPEPRDGEAEKKTNSRSDG